MRRHRTHVCQTSSSSGADDRVRDRLAQRGFTVAVVDPEPGGGAARVAAGMLAAVTELHYGEQTLLGLNLASARRYPDFAAELTEASGQDLGYRRCGTPAVAMDADDLADPPANCTPCNTARGSNRSG